MEQADLLASINRAGRQAGSMYTEQMAGRRGGGSWSTLSGGEMKSTIEIVTHEYPG